MATWTLSKIIAPDTLISIADVGASYMEEPPYQSLIKNGNARLIGFEPNHTECEKLKGMFGDPHQFYAHFVGRGGPATFYETNHFFTGSLMKPNQKVAEAFNGLWQMMTPVAEHHVTTVTLDSLFPDQDIDYIKIDVQGGELAVFEGAERLLTTTVAIQTEVEFVDTYENRPLFSDIDQYLRNRGFRFVKFLNPRSVPLWPCVIQNDPNVGNQFLWSDALYVKNILALELLSDQQLIKLATICHDVYNMSDFVYRILTEIERRSGHPLLKTYMSMHSQ